MLYQIYAIAMKELKLLMRDKSTLAVLFFLPIVFVTVMTFAGVGNQSVRAEKILVVNNDSGKVANDIIAQLKTEPKLLVQQKINNHFFTEKEAEQYLLRRGSDIGLILVFQKNFSETLLHSSSLNKNTLVKFIADPATGGQNLNPLEYLIKIHVMNIAGALAADRESHHKIDTKIHNRVQFKLVAPNGVSAYHTITSAEQNVPGYTIFGVFFIVQVIGNTFLREKENGTFDRLLISPLNKSVLLIGKLLPFYFVNVVQILFLFIFGHFVFHIGLGDSFAGLIAVTLATTAVANSLGLFIAAISKSAEQMGPLSGLILVCLATIGGIFIPYFEMPHLLQSISFFTPQAWALNGFQDILVRGYHFLAILPSVGMLLIFAAAFYFLALLRFRFNKG